MFSSRKSLVLFAGHGLLLFFHASLLLAQDAQFRRGDSNLDGTLDISDGIFTLRYIFLGEPSAGCDDASDVDDDGSLGITDCVFGMRFLFLDGAPPPPPFEGCGLDPTEDPIRCEVNERCLPAAACLSQALIDQALAGLPAIAFELCIPAGVLELPADPFQVSVCPAEGAGPCGATAQPGCAIQITSIKGTYTSGNPSVVLRFEGKVDDLPIAVTETLFNTTTTCLTDFHGADPSLPFSFDLTVPLVVEDRPGGRREISGIGEASVENVSLQLTASGGLVCRLFQAGQGAFIDLLIAPLDQAAAALTAGLTDQLVGLCLE